MSERHVCTNSDFLWREIGGLPVAVKYIAPYPHIIVNHAMVVYGNGGIFHHECFAGNKVIESIEIASDIAYKVRFLHNNAITGFMNATNLVRVIGLPSAYYNSAFLGCSKLEYVMFIQLPCLDVTGAFEGCSNLKYVVDLDRRSGGYSSLIASLPRDTKVITTFER
mgnify:CR=1 FL=1